MYRAWESAWHIFQQVVQFYSNVLVYPMRIISGVAGRYKEGRSIFNIKWISTLQNSQLIEGAPSEAQGLTWGGEVACVPPGPP